MQAVFLVINFGDRAHAGAALLESFDSILREKGFRYQISQSRSIEHCHELIAGAYNDGYRTLIVGGGDGTINVALNHPLVPQMTLGVLPLGTVNALARSIDLSGKNPTKALRLQLDSAPVLVDVGHIEDRRFICFASVGYDAEVVHRATGRIKKWLRRGAFGIVGIQEALQLSRRPRFQVQTDDETPRPARYFVLSNISNYAGARLFDATITSGTFQGFAFDGKSALSLVRLVGRAVMGPPVHWADRLPDAALIRAFRRLRITSSAAPAVEIDGEPYTPRNPLDMEFRLEPAGQSFLFPVRRFD